MSLISCAACDNQVSQNAASCPNCGEPVPKIPQPESPSWAGFLAIAVIGFCVVMLFLAVAKVGGSVDALTVILVGFVVYFLPWIIALSRGHHNGGSIAALNLLLGWTFLGWVLAFVWSVSAIKENPGT